MNRHRHPSINVVWDELKWKLTVGESYHIFFIEGNQPNAFHRWVQKVFLGFKWEKIK